MSEDIQTDTNEATFCDTDGPSAKCIDLEKSELIAGGKQDEVCDKQQFLVEKANSTFQELCKTLESEQTKLLELEERRKKLQEEMLLLKAEIEEEKQLFNSNIAQSIAENLSVLNKSCNKNSKVCEQSQIVDEKMESNFCACCEEEDHQLATARNLGSKASQETAVEDQVQYIRSELHNVLTQCIAEKSGD